MKKHTQKRNSGFTLVEMMVATFLFTLALTGLMFMSSRGLNASRNAQNQVVGSYLALEGIEAVRHVRDSAFISGDTADWDDVFGSSASTCLGGSVLCHFTYAQQNSLRIEPCAIVSGIVCPVYKTNTLYDQSGSPGSTLTSFRRSIRFDQVSSDEMTVTVVVSWPRGLVEYTTHLFMWSNV